MAWAAIGGAVASTVIGGVMSDSGGGGSGGTDPRITDNIVGGGNFLLGKLPSFDAQFLSQSNQFSKPNAIMDAQGAIASIFRDYQNTALPEIYQAQNSSGGYNASTGQLLANDAFAAANAKGAAVMLDTIQKYRTLQQNDWGALANLIRAIPGSGSSTSGPGNAQAAGQWADLGGNAIGAIIGTINKPSPNGFGGSNAGGWGTGTGFGSQDMGQYF